VESDAKMTAESAQETAQIGSRKSADASKAGGKLRLLSLSDLDKRTAAYRETRRLIDEIETDLGGGDRLSTGERQLIQRAAVLGAVLTDCESRWIEGEPIDPTSYCTIVNAQRRVFETIGLHRRARDVTPPDPLRYAEEHDAA
jgi:hypothetical protein